MILDSTEQGRSELRDMMIEMRTQLRILVERTDSTHSDHEGRIRALESRPDHADKLTQHAVDLAELTTRVAGLERLRWIMTGAAATGGGALGAFLAPLLGIIGAH